AAHDHVADAADVGSLAFDLAGLRILEHIVLPAAACALGDFDALLDEVLAMRVSGREHALADQGGIAAVGEDGAIHAIYKDVEVADDEFAVRIVDFGEGALAAAGFDDATGAFNQGFCVVRSAAGEGADGLLEGGRRLVKVIGLDGDLLQAGAVFLGHDRDTLDIVGDVGAGNALFADRVGDLVHHV